MTQANNAAVMREANKRHIINLIRKKSQSRADIARATGLSRAAVTILTDSLVEQGILINGEAVKSDLGRRPTLLHLNPDAFVSIGVDLCRDGCGILMTDFAGNILFEKKSALLESADQTIDLICHEIRLAQKDLGDRSVLGVCVCAPGPIDTAEGKILTPSGRTCFHNYHIKNALSARLPFPIYL